MGFPLQKIGWGNLFNGTHSIKMSDYVFTKVFQRNLILLQLNTRNWNGRNADDCAWHFYHNFSIKTAMYLYLIVHFSCEPWVCPSIKPFHWIINYMTHSFFIFLVVPGWRLMKCFCKIGMTFYWNRLRGEL